MLIHPFKAALKPPTDVDYACMWEREKSLLQSDHQVQFYFSYSRIQACSAGTKQDLCCGDYLCNRMISHNLACVGILEATTGVSKCERWLRLVGQLLPVLKWRLAEC